ncbi:MAG: DMT family transporter [Steroidobacteraceae bacterium]
MQYGAMAVTALVGASIAARVGLNATMNKHVESPMAAALVNFAVGTAILFLIVLFSRGSLPALAQAGAAPWWAWRAAGMLLVVAGVFLLARGNGAGS